MALTVTTLASAVAINDASISVASATGIAPGDLARVDNEFMQVVSTYVVGSTTVGVLRGRNSSATKAHNSGANVIHGLPAEDWGAAGQMVPVGNIIAGRPRVITSITATGTLTHAPAGSDHIVILNGTSVITLTIPVPTADMDGDMLVILSNGAAAHVPTFTSGLGLAGSGYDAITNNATGRFALVVFACNLGWNIPQGPALTGTVTNITGGIA